VTEEIEKRWGRRACFVARLDRGGGSRVRNTDSCAKDGSDSTHLGCGAPSGRFFLSGGRPGAVVANIRGHQRSRSVPKRPSAGARPSGRGAADEHKGAWARGTAPPDSSPQPAEDIGMFGFDPTRPTSWAELYQRVQPEDRDGSPTCIILRRPLVSGWTIAGLRLFSEGGDVASTRRHRVQRLRRSRPVRGTAMAVTDRMRAEEERHEYHSGSWKLWMSSPVDRAILQGTNGPRADDERAA